MIAKSLVCSSVVLAAISVMSWRLAAAGEGESKPNGALPLGTLSGEVVDPDGKPVAGARVWAYTWRTKSQESKLLADTRSGPDGRFRLGPVEPVYRHRFPILIDADGFARQYIHEGTYSIFPGADSDLGEIRLARGRVFTGQVFDADGKPYRNADIAAAVEVHDLGNTIGGIGPDYHVATDTDGRYRTPPLPVGDLYLTTQPPNCQLAYLSCRVAPGGEQELKPIRLERDLPLEGTIIDDSGKPIAGAQIYANAEHHLTSDADGKFTIHGFGPKPRFQLNVGKDGYVSIISSVKVEDDGIHIHWVRGRETDSKGVLDQLVVKMTPEARIEARATDAETGKPVHVDKAILCFFERKPGGEIVRAGCRSSDFEQPETGLIRVPYFTPDEYHLTVMAAGYHDAEVFTP
jgi:uncharacterized GH25 family protein